MRDPINFNADPDPHWKKMDPDPGYFFKIYRGFLTEQNFQICCLIFFTYFYAKTWCEPFRNQEIFKISLFAIVRFGVWE